ncbi:hypothetical protein M501DRAFT_1006499 [Patellaria atrata CBS 101060]|uniref:Autophagy-related protein 13 n=1 Tax=Patellaria atrata CBS 101060 TaxID=1346257 RepID=A0A9P4S768_9PEZI|nr:hypothetical protein M501DRAFT_1006499 [Patellaria atrata CBS 101060]
MHQLPRHRRTTSSATSPQTNPLRTNNQRDNLVDRTRSNMDAYTSDRLQRDDDLEDKETSEQKVAAQARNDSKLNQIIQQFFVKSTLTIVSSRTVLPQSLNRAGEVRQNKWFNVVLDDTDVLVEPLIDWRSNNVLERRPSPLIIEIYLNTAELKANQTLCITDDDGKRFDVQEALEPPTEPSGRSGLQTLKPTQIILERWLVEVGEEPSSLPAEMDNYLPNVYKKGVVLFRSLYTYARLLPAWKFWRRIAKHPANHPSLKPRYRIINGDFRNPRRDTLDAPLYTHEEPVTANYQFAPSSSPVGPLRISVTYRVNCDFQVDDSESLLSSHLMGADEDFFKPSLHSGRTQNQRAPHPGSLPVMEGIYSEQGRPDPSQAYGSMSTFHQVGPQTSTSPISTLRAARDLLPESPIESPPQKIPPNHRTALGSKSSMRSGEGGVPLQRRTSVSFQGFKAGSLSSSPAPGGQVPPSPSSSLGRTSNPASLTHTRNRSSLNALPQAALRTPGLPNETAIASSASSSPKPAPITRYSSSFANRKSRLSSGGASKTEDDKPSSGKASLASSAQQGSVEGEGASSGSIQTDDDNISDFLKLLEQKKELKSFTRNDTASRDASMRKTTAALSKYHRMRDSHAALSDSMSSSLLLHRSSTSSSRQLSSVPPMIAGTSVSTSSSPGKPISPHTPHTPAIPSRLSANSIIDYSEPHRSRSRPRGSIRRDEEPTVTSGSDDTAPREQGTTAIDIPTSPRPWPFHRNVEEDNNLFNMRSTSLPADDRGELSLSELLLAQDAHSSQVEAQIDTTDDRDAPVDRASEGTMSRPDSRDDPGRRGASFSPRDTLPRGGYRVGTLRRGPSSAHGSSTSLASRRYSSSRPSAVEDDEPLLFTMSDFGSQSRRSLEDGRGGSSAGAGDRRRGGSPYH